MTERRTHPLMWLGIGLIVAIALLAIFGALSFSAYGGYYGGGGYYGMMGGGGWGWAILMMGIPLGILIIILVIILLALRDSTPAPLAPAAPSALETLNARYARNEITREEFLRIRGDLTGAEGGRP